MEARTVRRRALLRQQIVAGSTATSTLEGRRTWAEEVYGVFEARIDTKENMSREARRLSWDQVSSIGYKQDILFTVVAERFMMGTRDPREFGRIALEALKEAQHFYGLLFTAVELQ